MIEWVAIATALASAAQMVGGELAKEGLKTSLKPASEHFDRTFLRGYKARQHENHLRRALEATETAFRASPGISATQADAVLTRVAQLARNPNLQKQTLALLLTLDDDSPSRIPDDILRAFGLADELRPAFAQFLFELRLHFAQIETYKPLMQFALDVRAQTKRDETNAWLAAMASAQGILTTSDHAQALRDYLAHVREKNTYLSFLFVRPRSREATTEAELEAVFVPLQVHDPERNPKGLGDPSGLRRDPSDLEREKPQTINDILPRYDCLLLKGAPGSGKTTLLRHLALAFANGDAREKLAWEGDPLFPILVPLRNYGAYLDAHRKEFPDPAPMSLLTYIQQHFGQNALALTPDFFRQRLENGKCLVLLDALDEVSDPGLRADVAQHATQFVKHYRKRGNRFVLSSRPKGYDEVAEFLRQPIVCEVQPLAPEGRAELVRKLCRALERDATRANHDAATLLDEIPRKDKVDELSRNPLFCTTIVLVSKYRGATLPERRVDIFKEIVELLLGFWDTQRDNVTEARKLAMDDGTDRVFRDVGEAVEAKQRALAHLAYWMQKDGQAETPEPTALAQLAQFFRAREGGKDISDTWARRFLVVAHQRSGLFVEGAPNLYNFSHSNFREYLAATELVKELDNDLVRIVLEHVGDAWWEETILLAMALKELGDPRRKLVMDELLARGHLIMAGKCAVDMSDRLPAPLRQEITDKLLARMQANDVPVKERALAGEVLDALGWLPPDLDAFVKIPAGDPSTSLRMEFFIAKYPVTYHQFQKFIDAGGYANEKFWRDQTGFDEKGHEKKLGDEAWKWLQESGGAERRPWYWDNPRFHRAGYPVIGVTWYEASAYCRWLTEKFQIADFRSQIGNSNLQLPTSNIQFRLPTEAEWVRAAGGEQNKRYPWDEANPKSQDKQSIRRLPGRILAWRLMVLERRSCNRLVARHLRPRRHLPLRQFSSLRPVFPRRT
ncbi:MAG: SUMF1/EgtB/PvdO family nonheme iron enzyme [Chloroflexi bacterium]|nr:SUMF1/EgtB/PvdO family nonheme iron enzyme [Chloroflexota bacterium]